MTHKLLAIALLTSLSACESIEIPPDAPEVVLALAAEQAAQLRCPRNDTEMSVLVNARSAFDAFTNVGVAARMLIDNARMQTDIICDLTSVR